MAQWIKHLPCKCKDCIASITHTHTAPSPPQQQQKEHAGAFKNLSELDSLLPVSLGLHIY